MKWRRAIQSRPRPARAILLLAVPTALAVVAAAVMLGWRIPTHVEIVLPLDRIRFVVDPALQDPLRVTAGIDLESLTVRRFADVSMQALRVQTAADADFDLERDGFPDAAWRPLVLPDRHLAWRPRPGTRDAQITVEPVPQAASAASAGKTAPAPGPAKPAGHAGLGTLDPLFATAGAEMVIARPIESPRRLDLVQRRASGGGPIAAAVSLRGRGVQITATDTVASAIGPPASATAGSTSYRVDVAPDSPHLVLRAENQLWLQAAVATDRFLRLGAHAIPVSEVQLAAVDEQGVMRSSIIAEGEIRYRDFPEIKPVALRRADRLEIGELERFTVAAIEIRPGREGLDVVLQGLARHVHLTTGARREDAAMTALEYLVKSRHLGLLFAIVVWVFPTTIGAHRLYEQFRTRPT